MACADDAAFGRDLELTMQNGDDLYQVRADESK